MTKDKLFEISRNLALVFAGIVLVWTRVSMLQDGTIEPRDFGLVILFLLLVHGYIKRNYPRLLHR